MDWQNIINIIAAITGVTGGGIGIKSLQSNNNTKEKIKILERVNQNQFNDLKMHILNIETKIDLMFLSINNTNTNEINITKQEKENK